MTIQTRSSGSQAKEKKIHEFMQLMKGQEQKDGLAAAMPIVKRGGE
jgi:hypothetical protein